MKKLIFIALILFSCTNKTTEYIQTADNVEDAVMYIESYQGDIKDFRLALGEEISLGGKIAKRDLAVGFIGKTILSTKGWVFDGYEEKGDLRIYKFKKK